MNPIIQAMAESVIDKLNPYFRGCMNDLNGRQYLREQREEMIAKVAELLEELSWNLVRDKYTRLP